MSVGAILRRWIRVLAALLVGWREAWRARRSLVVSRDAAEFLIRAAGAEREETFSIADAGAQAAERLAQMARNSLVVLELPPEKVVGRRISVPVKAREFLPGIIRNQIDRLSPWQADEAVYGFAAGPNRKDMAALDVQVMITSRHIIEAARAEIAKIGLAVDRIVVRGAAPEAPVVLWSCVDDAPLEASAGLGRLIGTVIAGCIGLSFAVTLWALISSASIRDASEEIATRVNSLERQLHTARNAVAAASLDPAEGAWIVKQTAPSAIILLEALSRALPETAHLTDLQFERGRVRLIGLAADAPSLIAPLEQSGHFTGVHFFAPTTRGSDAMLYQFHIEAQTEPLLNVTAD